jgi:polysaccharide deacetylase family protein (PEP-CTERM system associated)
MKAVMSVDVEEWFHIPIGFDNFLPSDQWDNAEMRVQDVLPKMWDIFERNSVTATFFFLGWIAEKHPDLVKETFRRGHEVATHGYAHKLIYNQTQDEFSEDIFKSKSILENLTGHSVIGYRAPGFSITPATEWAFEILAENAIKYDSSIFPGRRFFGHYDKFNKEPTIVQTSNKEIIEFPQTVVDFGITRLSCFGGGYFRLFPESIILNMATIIKKSDRPLILYIHPRDIDIHQPKIPFPFLKKIRHYINISKTEQKLARIAGCFNFQSFAMLLSDVAFLETLQHSASSTKHTTLQALALRSTLTVS